MGFMEATLSQYFLNCSSGEGCEGMREVLLNTGSTIEEGRLAKGGNKLGPEYVKECAVCEISHVDYAELGFPDRVRIWTPDRKHSVAVHARPARSLQPGQIFMPRAIWSNLVVDPDTFSTGSPLYKGSPVIIEPTQEDVLSAAEIVRRHYSRGKR